MTKEFRKWLDSKKLSIQDFATATGIDYNTVARWSSMKDRQPRKAYKMLVKQKFPDCPLAD